MRLAEHVRREVLFGCRVAVAQRDGVLDDVLELADVARIAMLQQQAPGGDREAADAAAVQIGELAQEVAYQQRDVFAPIA
jgi:hypothetical protein